jgi:hypothetical protein
MINKKIKRSILYYNIYIKVYNKKKEKVYTLLLIKC